MTWPIVTLILGLALIALLVFALFLNYAAKFNGV